MDNNYDLTTKDGLKQALKFLKGYGVFIPGLGPIVPLAVWLVDIIFSPEKSTEKQAEVARNLIIEGKKQGVKKMNVKIAHDAGINIGANVEGIPLKFKVGNSGNMEIEVEYF
jgi:prolyl-tRNA synthetase